jgi:glycosyltransferase involved in cell wall biosynthesis
LAKRSTAFNGKFLASEPTGVHRVARELIKSVDHILHAQNDGELRAQWQLFKPKDSYQPLELNRISARTVGFNTWQPWEQIDLPFFARNQILVNLCNLAPIAHPRSVTMIHDAQVFSSPASYSPAFRNWYQFALPLIGRRALRVLTVSEFSRAQLVRYGIAPYDKIAVIHNGVDHLRHGATSLDALMRFGLAPGSFVLALANTQAHKNLRLLFEAFQSSRLSGLTLALVGGAGPPQFLAVGLKPPSSTVFTGPIGDDEFRGLMENAICFACPSTTEGFGLPPLEAMSLGCPAVVAPCGALPEVCGNGAVSASAHDPEPWIEEILRLREDADHRTMMIELGRGQASQFTWANSAAALLKEISSVEQ